MEIFSQQNQNFLNHSRKIKKKPLFTRLNQNQTSKGNQRNTTQEKTRTIAEEPEASPT